MKSGNYKVVLLATEKPSDIIKLGVRVQPSLHYKKDMNNDMHNASDASFQHLYFLEDCIINEGDWVINENNELEKAGDIAKLLDVYGCFKIVATTNPDLRHLFGIKEGGCAAISDLFVQEYIKSYNSGKVITEVELKLKLNKYPDLHGVFYDLQIEPDNTVIVLSHNQTVNTVDFEPIKIDEDNVDYLKATIKDREILISQLDYKRKELQESSDKNLTYINEMTAEIKELAEALQEMVDEFNVVTDARNEIEQEDAMNNAIELLKKYKKE